MSKPGQQSKSGARSKPPKKPQRHPAAPSGPSARTQARLEPFVKIALAAIAIGTVLVILERTGRLDELLIGIGWKSAEAPAIVEPAR